MTLEEVQKKIEFGIEQSQVTMEGDGCNCSAVVVSPIFEGLSLLQRQRAVLSVVSEETLMLIEEEEYQTSVAACIKC